MDRKKLEELIRLVEDSDIQELHVSRFMSSVKIIKGGTSAAVVTAAPAAVHAPLAAPLATQAPAVDAAEDVDG
ncbi:acetyl-CoA carboxylase biotin carboxyl carrier protein, partial [bacterium]|nr:acetyl-CoA carboxylase biotin carboxyl carrier protein [bacterium]